MKKCGWSLSDQGLKAAVRGITTVKTDDRIAESVSIRCDTEEDIFRACGVPYRTPAERNAEVVEGGGLVSASASAAGGGMSMSRGGGGGAAAPRGQQQRADALAALWDELNDE